MTPQSERTLSGIQRVAFVAGLAVLSAALVDANAAPVAYTGATNGAWNASSNWNSGAGPVPGSGDDAQFNTNTRNINLNVTATVNSLAFTVSNQQIAGATNTVNSAGSLTINNGVTHTSNAGTTFFRIPTITLGNSQSWTLSGSQGSIASSAGLTITPPNNTSPNNTFDLNGKVLTLNGTGQLSFGGTTFTSGDILIQSGSLRLSAGTGTPINMGGTGTVTVKPDAALLLGSNTTTNSTITFTKSIVMGQTAGNPAVLQYGGVQNFAQTIAAPISWSGTSTFDNLWAMGGGSTNPTAAWTFSGDWSGDGTINMITTTSGAQTALNRTTRLSGDNSGLTGVVNNNHSISGVVEFGSSTAGSATAEWKLSNAIAVYQLNGSSVSMGALSGTTGTVRNNHATNASTLTLGGKNINPTFAGTIENGGAAVMNIVKTGTDIQTLTANNTYTGSTLVSNGTLQLSGAGQLSGTSGITINGAGAKFITHSSVAVTAPITLTSGLIGGTGAINTAVTIGAGGTVSPGASPGTQPYGAGQTWANSGTYLWEINQVDTSNVLQDALKGTNPGHDWLDITGTLAVTADTFNPFVIQLSSMGAAVTNWDNTKDYTWTIATASTAVSGFAANLFSLDTSGFTANNSLDPNGVFSITADANNVYLNYNIIPEPSSLALLLWGAVGLMAMFRNRRN